MTAPKITLVTVTYNAADVWTPFMASLEAQVDADWHLVVIDNQSRDGTIALLEELRGHPRVTLVLNDGNLGVAAANNQGIRIGLENGADRIVLINNDTEFDPGLLAGMERALGDQHADAVSPVIPFFDAPDRIWYAGGAFSRWMGVMNYHEHEGKPVAVVGDRPFVTDYAPTCCVMFRRDVFERIGLMDERYFVYWDDADFLWRMKQAGIKLVVDPRVQLLHKVSISTGGKLSDFSIRYNFRNQVYYARKHHGPLWAAYSALAAAAKGAGRVVLSGDKPRHLGLRLAALRKGFAMRQD